MVSRRRFLEVGSKGALIAGVLGVDSLIPKLSSADHGKSIGVIQDMTAITGLQYVFSQSGIKDRVTFGLVNRVMSVGLGEKSPQIIYVGANDEEILLSDQLVWRVKKGDIKDFKHKEEIIRDPDGNGYSDNVNFAFPGDHLLLRFNHPDKNKALDEARAKKIDGKYSDHTIKVNPGNFKDFVGTFYADFIKKKVAEIEGMNLEDKRKERYLAMAKTNPAEFVSRAVESGTQAMYAGLAAQGVKFATEKGLEKKVGRATPAPNHRGKPYHLIFKTESGARITNFGTVYKH